MKQAKVPVHVPLVTEPWGILRSLREARKNVLSIIPKIATTQPMVSGKTGKRWHMVMDPSAIERMLLERLDDYPKSDVTKNLLRPAIGESLFIAQGVEWRWQRRTAAPVFSHRNVTNLGPVMTAAAERCIARIEKSTAPSLNMADEMVSATFEVISDVTFSGGDAFDRDAVHSAIDAYIAEAGKVSLFDVLGFPDWVPRPNRLISSSAMRQTKAIADQAIDARRHQPRETGLDLLDLLLAGEDPKSQRKMDTGELRDNLLTFIVAGHETTALTLSWALYLCAFDQDIQEQARTQAKAVLGDRIATAEDVAQLPFISQIVDETLRLYPPAGIISRTALSHDTLCDRDIQPKDTVMIPIYALHRNHLIWDNPDQFDPTRFANRRSIPRYGYLPFGDGPRICIGASFALQEAVIILASLLAKFKFTPVTGRDPKPVMILTLRPEGGVWLKPEPV